MLEAIEIAAAENSAILFVSSTKHFFLATVQNESEHKKEIATKKKLSQKTLI